MRVSNKYLHFMLFPQKKANLWYNVLYIMDGDDGKSKN